jgi:hypothetical protein
MTELLSCELTETILHVNGICFPYAMPCTCRFADVYQRFGESYCVHLQGSSDMKMSTIRCYLSTRIQQSLTLPQLAHTHTSGVTTAHNYNKFLNFHSCTVQHLDTVKVFIYQLMHKRVALKEY